MLAPAALVSAGAMVEALLAAVRRGHSAKKVRHANGASELCALSHAPDVLFQTKDTCCLEPRSLQLGLQLGSAQGHTLCTRLTSLYDCRQFALKENGCAAMQWHIDSVSLLKD